MNMTKKSDWFWLSDVLEQLVLRLSSALAWILVMALVTVSGIDVLERQIFHVSGESINTCMAALFLNLAVLFIGSAYLQDVHVRIDIIREKMSGRMTAWIELFGNLAVIVPVSVIIIKYGGSQALSAFQQGESVGGFGDLPLMWLFEASIPAGFLLLLMASISTSIRTVLFLLGHASKPNTLYREETI